MSRKDDTVAAPPKKKRSEQGGKTRLVRAVRKCGHSVRKSTKLVNAVFHVIAAALKEGRTVGLPIGTLSVKKYGGNRKAYDRKAVDIRTSKPMRVKGTRPGDRKVVRWRPLPDLLKGDPETPAVEPQEAAIPPRESEEDAEAYRLTAILNVDRALFEEIDRREPNVKAYIRELRRVIEVQSYVSQLLGGVPAPANLVEDLVRRMYRRGATTERLLERLRELGQQRRVLKPNEVLGMC